jgi:hypothetical protein
MDKGEHMTQDEIIEMANKASKEWLKELPSPEETANPVPKRFLEIFAELVAAKAVAELKSQEPDYWLGYGLQAHTEKPFENATALYTHPPQRTEQNFCPRCGKRTKDLTTIHTCTPPQD